MLVIGAGPIGCMHVAMARNHGAGKIFLADISEERLQLAQRIGADLYINSAQEKSEKK